MGDKGFVDVPDVQCIHDTEKALLCVVEDEEVWVPKSVVGDDSEVFEKGHSGTLWVKEWFANKHGWLGRPDDGDEYEDATRDLPGNPGDYGDQD